MWGSDTAPTHHKWISKRNLSFSTTLPKTKSKVNIEFAMSISHTAVRTKKATSFYKTAERTFKNKHFTSSGQNGTMSLGLFCSRWQGGTSHDQWPRNFGEISESRRLMRLHQAPGCYLVCLGNERAIKCGQEVLLDYLLRSYWWYCRERRKNPQQSLSPLTSLHSFLDLQRKETDL